jgi:hypothetical protein
MSFELISYHLSTTKTVSDHWADLGLDRKPAQDPALEDHNELA